jgi:hypothetical protein
MSVDKSEAEKRLKRLTKTMPAYRNKIKIFIIMIRFVKGGKKN